ncbi:HAD superfamily [Sesbania bispinosa]|nr:HAD superfamily [Sesbania bispinosa]
MPSAMLLWQIFACHHEPLNNTGLFILLLAWLLLWRTMPLINRSHCTTTEFSTVENREKPLVLKELWKLWEKVEPSLPWEKGEFNESNTLLLDDSPYKALMNPMHTAIFPYSYQYTDTKDSSLGPGGDLRAYLEGLAKAENVQEYVSLNPFGQRPIRETNPSWRFYRRVIESVKRRQQHTRHSLPERGQTAYKTKQ